MSCAPSTMGSCTGFTLIVCDQKSMAARVRACMAARRAAPAGLAAETTEAASQGEVPGKLAVVHCAHVPEDVLASIGCPTKPHWRGAPTLPVRSPASTASHTSVMRSGAVWPAWCATLMGTKLAESL